MIPILRLDNPAHVQRLESLWSKLRLDVRQLISDDPKAATVRAIIADVIDRGDAAVVDNGRKFDDPDFTVEQMRVTPTEMAAAAERVPAGQLSGIRRAITQVREYQQHILPIDPPVLTRPGVELGLRFTPLDSAGLYFPGGKASYPSSLIMLAVPARVAGVKTIVVATPPSRYGRSDLVLAACHELKLPHVFRAGGAAAIAAMAVGTATIPRVDKIVGPGNLYVQLAKRELAGVVGVDGFLGPSEIVVIADETCRPDFVAADLIAQAEHDPGSCYLLTTKDEIATAVVDQITRQLRDRTRADALQQSLVNHSAVVVGPMDSLLDWANRLAAEHVNLQVADPETAMKQLRHAGAIFVGPWSPVAAGDYVAGPSHCLPTNTTARFASGVSVYEFLKRTGVVRYDQAGLMNDALAIESIAAAEGLDGHAASVAIRRG